MSFLAWNPTDFLECFETIPDTGDYEESFHYIVEKHGLRLEVSVYPFAKDIYITLFREGIDDPLIDFKMYKCSGVQYINDKRGSFLEFAPSQVYGDRFHNDFVIPTGLRLAIKPSISLKFF